MSNTVENWTNINFLTKNQYDGVTNPATDELWAVEIPVITESYINGTEGYRVWSDGMIEQWGSRTTSGDSGSLIVSLLKTTTSTSYNIMLSTGQNALSGTGHVGYDTSNVGTSSFKIYWNNLASPVIKWKIIGY